jgi:DNA invertase Pin-like site-specific DNA recombinase
MRIGYARVSTNEQQPVSQIDALTEAGCERIYTETASGARRDRPELDRALDRPGPR